MTIEAEIFKCTSPRLLILGGGALVSTTYIPALQELGWSARTVVVEPWQPVADNLKQLFPKLQVWTEDFRQALARPNLACDFDAVVVALPNILHEEACSLSLDVGLHILCEKPLTLNAASCLRLAEYAERSKRVLAVGMVRRLLPTIGLVHEALAQGIIGDLVSIDIEDGGPYAWPSESGAPFMRENGGVLADMGIHFLDLIYYLAGKLIPIHYRDDACGGVEANVEYNLQTETGVPVRLILSRTHFCRNTVIFRGERGELILERDNFSTCEWKPDRGGFNARLAPTKPFSNPTWPLAFESCFAEQFVRFAQSILGNRQDYVTAREAAHTVGLVEWAYTKRKRKVVETSLADRSKDRPGLSVSPVAVTGGTGFIGVNLVGRLAELGFDEIRVPVRRYRTLAPVACYPIDIRRYDLLNYKSVLEVLSGVRYVFHLAYGQDGPKSSRITVDGTKNLVEAAIANQVDCVVIASTAGVFGLPNTNGNIDGKYIDETWPYAAAYGEYGASKTEMEKWCLKRAKSSATTRIVIINPTIVYGPWGKTFTQMPVQMAKAGTFCWIQSGSGIVNYTYVDNLVDAMLLAIPNPHAHGERFIINDGWTNWFEFLDPFFEKLSTEIPSYTKEELQAINKKPEMSLLDIAKTVLANSDFRQAVKQVPVTSYLIENTRKLKPEMLDKFRSSSGGHSLLQAVFNGKKQPIPPAWLADLFGPAKARFSSAKAKRILGWEPKVGLTTGRQIAISWLEEHHVY